MAGASDYHVVGRDREGRRLWEVEFVAATEQVYDEAVRMLAHQEPHAVSMTVTALADERTWQYNATRIRKGETPRRRS